MRRAFAIFWLLLVVAAPRLASAQNVTGTYNLTVILPGSCTWAGLLSLAQSGTTLTGSGTIQIQPGSDVGCASTLSGSVNGTVTGSTINFGLATGSLGTAQFTGTISPDGLTLSGTWQVGSSGSGTWTALRVPSTNAPTMGGATLLLLGSLLLVAGIRRTRRA
ncbi:MAG: hypothetical protein U0587_11695 [Candidatus Binatia bacterium]